MSTAQTGRVTTWTRLTQFVGRYRRQTLLAIAVCVSLLVLAAQVVPEVQLFLISSGIIPFLTLLAVLDLSAAVHAAIRKPTFEIASNQDRSLPTLIESVPACRAESADLLEYAGATTLPLIRAIRREHVPLRILVKHPETVDGLQRQRMITTLDTLYTSVFEDYRGQYEIRCYRQPYSLRGRMLGSRLLELGWLTPDPKRQTAFGHANPSLLIDLTAGDHRELRSFFERTFEELWTAPDTVDALAVLNSYQSTPPSSGGGNPHP